MTASGNRPLRGLPTNLVERKMSKFLREPPSVKLAAGVIVTATSLIVVVGGVLMRIVDHNAYKSVWYGMWWVLQTVTTVGFGDLPPSNLLGYLVTAAVMLWGIAFLAIITAAITSVFVARAQRERAAAVETEAAGAASTVDERFDQIDAQLQQLRELLEQTPPTP